MRTGGEPPTPITPILPAELLVSDLQSDSIALDLVLVYWPGAEKHASKLLVNAGRSDFPIDSAQAAMIAARYLTETIEANADLRRALHDALRD